MDGSSSMRRTATLSLLAEEKENNLANVDHLFSVNKKCKLQLGIRNTVPNYVFSTLDSNGNQVTSTIDYRSSYGDIVWFPLGIFVMFNPSIAHGLDGVTISMQLKDKMCLLNGDIGGQIHSSVEFNYKDEAVDINALSIHKEEVLIYDIIKQLVNHWGNEQLSKIIISEVPLQIKAVCQWQGDATLYLTKTAIGYQLFTDKSEAQAQKLPDAKIISTEQYYDAGFIYTDFVYPLSTPLTCNAGETVTSVLDKIIQIIGNYEYFYDVEGNFIFRQKQNYLNMSNTAYWAKEAYDKKQDGTDNEIVCDLPSDVYQADMYRLSKPVYDFVSNEYTTAYNNSLNYNNIKNDFVVWGSYPSSSGKYRIPCRFHLAIDKKPQINQQHKIVLFKDDFDTIRAVAYDQTKQYKDDPEHHLIGIVTNYSKDWREQLYYQMLQDQIRGTGQNTEQNNNYFQYYAELKEEFPKIYDIQSQTWKQDMQQHPDRVNYYLDFIDENSELGQYSVSNIGRRAIIIGDNNQGINCVFEPLIPDIIYVDPGQFDSTDEMTKFEEMLDNYGQTWTQISSDFMDLMKLGGKKNSCFERIKDLLYQYTHINNTISITTLPIYYLEPNTRITVEDTPGGIYGDYIIQSISLPLDVNSTMSINAYKALQKI